jgi:hypothetical protein
MKKLVFECFQFHTAVFDLVHDPVIFAGQGMNNLRVFTASLRV